MATNVKNNLRPQTVGGLLDKTFRLYRRHFVSLMVLTVCIYLPYLILESLFNIHTQTLLSGMLQNVQDPALVQQQLISQIPALVVILLFTIISAFVIIPLLYGTILNIVVSLQYEGQEVPVAKWQAFRHALRRLLPVLGTNVVRWILYIVASLVVGGVVGGVGALFTAIKLTPAAVGVAVVLLSLTGLVILIWFAVKLAFVPSVTLEEGISFFTAIRRSYELTKGNLWRIIGYFIVVQLIIFVVSIGFGLLFSLVPAIIFQSILTDLVGVLVTPFSLVAMANLYLDLRIRTEAPDLAAWLRDE
ncbi:glycerophosphoryl diester phosphodiesterase membrane domain-containing protein [Alicyclobacillus mengziensis]|uniref:Glycerophosphoryl diester phosphodiesterase membrane domain-containing protein n=1 Tax=Alicyclobacillus mengziensis TaxID=2931921 RepID=A0A9X7Z6I9_9BACL|nr:glycerophosphoryl diester phosphodiesterase membrane domain-containing protein [Alicyclobacillus mengziensis]QSO46426.1 glycerophosphoryl diester phosphodiesterase membrane domain-containing protein [Alicyclobacillus mengziensis]